MKFLVASHPCFTVFFFSCTALFLTSCELKLESSGPMVSNQAVDESSIGLKPPTEKALSEVQEMLAVPVVHSDATIRWPDLQYQAKPDGTLMYLVAKHGLLIENSLFHIEAPRGSAHANLLPWEMRQQTEVDGFCFIEPVKIGDVAGQYSYSTRLLSERLLQTQIDFVAGDYKAQRQTLHLPLKTYAGKAFELDGERIEYGELDLVSEQHRSVIVPRQSFTSFCSLAGSELGFTQ
jgi:hypothetical protein